MSIGYLDYKSLVRDRLDSFFSKLDAINSSDSVDKEKEFKEVGKEFGICVDEVVSQVEVA